MLHPSIYVDDSTITPGKGLFTSSSLAKGVVVWKLEGPTYSWREIKQWSRDVFDDFMEFGFQCGEDRYSYPMDLSRYTNHSCDPNTWWLGDDKLAIRHAIEAGTELTYDYASADCDLTLDMNCSCGASNCRGIVTHDDCLNPSFAERYRGHLPTHVLSKIKRSKRQGSA